MQEWQQSPCGVGHKGVYDTPFQISAKKMGFYSHENKTHFNEEGFALRLVLRVFGTPKWRTLYLGI